MQLSEHKRRRTGEIYYVFHYGNDDEGFYLLRRPADPTLYPLAVLVWPRTQGWIAKINWADFGSLDRKVVKSEIFTVNEKDIVPIAESKDIEITATHRALWIHCAMMLKQRHNEEQTAKALSLPPGSPLLVIPPVWQVWRSQTVPEFYDAGEQMF